MLLKYVVIYSPPIEFLWLNIPCLMVFFCEFNGYEVNEEEVRIIQEKKSMN